MHYLGPELMRYMQQVNDYLQYQTRLMQQMNSKIQNLEKELDGLKQTNSQSPVIRNEYRFDLLKIEKLEGTLNIGLNPSPGGADSSIEEFAVGQSINTPTATEEHNPEMLQGIQEQVNDYLSSDAYRALEAIETRYQYPLDEAYRKFIMEDVRKQIDRRIRYYLQKQPEQTEHAQQSIIEHVKKDIEKTFEAFIKNLPRRENDS